MTQKDTSVEVVNRLIWISSIFMLILALPFARFFLQEILSNYHLLQNPFYIFNVIAIMITLIYPIIFIWDEIKQRNIPDRVALSIRSQFDYSTWLRFDLLGLEVALPYDIFVEPEKETEAEKIVNRLKIGTEPGYIYIMRREDGVIKIGRSNNTDRRLSQHEKDYGKRFDLLHRFTVPDTAMFERLALSLTSQFEYREDARLELRDMTKTEIDDFVTLFRECCILAITR